MEDKGRLTILTHKFPPRQGGGETLKYLLAKYLSRKGWDVSVVAGTKKGHSREWNSISAGVKVNYVPFLEGYSDGKVGIGNFWGNIYEVIKKTSPHIIHAFDFFPGYIGSVFAQYNNIPLVFTYFNTPLSDGRVIKMFSDVDVERSLLLHLAKDIRLNILITISKYFAKNAAELGFEEQCIRWCYPGPDPEFFKPERKNLLIKKKYGVEKGEYLIVIPARIIPRKKIEVALKAVRLNSKIPIKVVISSGGIVQPGFEKYYNYIKSLIRRYKLTDKIIMPSVRIGFEELGELYASADIGIMPSEVEGLGLGILEMMKCSVPVIATRTKGIDEIIKDKLNGLLFKEGDHKELYMCIEYLVKNREIYQKMKIEAEKTIEDKFNIHEYVKLHDESYKQLLRREIN